MSQICCVWCCVGIFFWLVYGSFRNCLINVITWIPMERPPYNPYNYILWDFPSPSLNVKYNKSKSQWHSLLRQCLCLWLSILTTAPSKWRKRKYWDRVNRRWWMCEMVGIVEVGEGIVLVWGFYLKSILNSTQLMGLQDHKPTNAYPWVGIQSHIRNDISKH